MTDATIGGMPTRRLNLYAPDRDSLLWEVAREAAYRRRVSLSQLVTDAVRTVLLETADADLVAQLAEESQGGGGDLPPPPHRVDPSPRRGRARAREGHGDRPRVLGETDE